MLLFLIGGALVVGASSAQGVTAPRLPRTAAEIDAPRERATDSLSAAAISFQLRYGPARDRSSEALPRRRGLGRDKVKHVVVSGLWTLSTQYVLVNKAGWTERDALPASVASSAAIGVVKELYDASRATGEASAGDLVADAVGIGLAAGVIVL